MHPSSSSSLGNSDPETLVNSITQALEAMVLARIATDIYGSCSLCGVFVCVRVFLSFFPFLSFPVLSFPVLSFPVLSCPFLSFPSFFPSFLPFFRSFLPSFLSFFLSFFLSVCLSFFLSFFLCVSLSLSPSLPLPPYLGNVDATGTSFFCPLSVKPVSRTCVIHVAHVLGESRAINASSSIICSRMTGSTD